MINVSKSALIALGAGIASGVILIGFIHASPYTLAIGPVIGIFLAKPLTPKTGAVYGLIIGVPLTIYLVMIDAIPSGISTNPLLGLLEVIFIMCFWGLYGAALAWLKQNWEKGKAWFS